MPCNPLVQDGVVVGVVCSLGPYSHLVEAHCPWCCLGDEVRVVAFREVFGGYESPDLVCGSCGQSWSPDYGPRKMSEERREEGVALVAEMLARGIVVGPSPSPSVLSEEPSQRSETP